MKERETPIQQTRHFTNVLLALVHRLRYWPNIKTTLKHLFLSSYVQITLVQHDHTLGQCIVFAGTASKL